MHLAPLVLLAALAAAPAGAGQPDAPVAAATMLRAGFAARPITPGVGPGNAPVWLAGFDTGRAATGVHDDLWARAVAIGDERRTVVLVAVDLIGVFLDDVAEARRRLGRRHPGAALVVASTHNHEGPDTMGLWGPGRFSSGVDRGYLETVRAAIVAAADEALSRLEPARLLTAATRTPGLIEDGRLPRVIDDELVVLQAVGAQGRTLGTLVRWSNHPEALGARNTLVTSDFPHYLRARMEERLGGRCVFVVGAIGGLMTPLGLKLEDEGGRPVPADSFALAQAVGERAAEAGVRALREAGRTSTSAHVEYRSASVAVPLENRLFRLAAFLGVLDRRLYSAGRPATTLFGDDLQTEVGYLRLGDFEALLVPGEIYPELVSGRYQDPQDPAADFPGTPRERALDTFLRSGTRTVIGLANDEIGYLIPRSQWDEAKPFAYGRADSQYGEINSPGPQAAGRIAEALAKLVGP